APQELQQHQDLAEQHLGDWQGLDRRTFLMSRRQEPASFWYADADERAPNGESFVDLMARVGTAIARLTEAATLSLSRMAARFARPSPLLSACRRTADSPS